MQKPQGLFGKSTDYLSSFCLGVYETTKEIVGGLSTLYHSKPHREAVKESFSSFWSGFSRPYDLSIVNTLIPAENTRKGLALASYGALYYLAVTLIYEELKVAASVAIPDTQTITERYKIDFLVGALISLYAFSKVQVPIWGINAAIEKEKIKDKMRNHEHFPGCDCDATDITMAKLTSNPYYWAEYVAVDVVSQYVGGFLAAPLFMLVEGRGIIGYPIASKYCIEHREELLARNKMFTVGLGAQLYLTNYFISKVISYLAGIPHTNLLDAAVYRLIYPYYVVIAHAIDRGMLQDESEALNVFQPVHSLTMSGLKNSVPHIASLFDPNASDSALFTFAKRVANSSLGQLIIPYELKSLKVFVKTPQSEFYFDLTGEDMMEKVIDLRATGQGAIENLAKKVDSGVRNVTGRFFKNPVGILSYNKSRLLKTVIAFEKSGVWEQAATFLESEILMKTRIDGKRVGFNASSIINVDSLTNHTKREIEENPTEDKSLTAPIETQSTNSNINKTETIEGSIGCKLETKKNLSAEEENVLVQMQQQHDACKQLLTGSSSSLFGNNNQKQSNFSTLSRRASLQPK